VSGPHQLYRVAPRTPWPPRHTVQASWRDRPLGVRQCGSPLHPRRAFVGPPFRAVPVSGAAVEHRVAGRHLAYGAVESACHPPARRVVANLTAAVRVKPFTPETGAGIGPQVAALAAQSCTTPFVGAWLCRHRVTPGVVRVIFVMSNSFSGWATPRACSRRRRGLPHFAGSIELLGVTALSQVAPDAHEYRRTPTPQRCW
jgi:hypothetical protein